MVEAMHTLYESRVYYYTLNQSSTSSPATYEWNRFILLQIQQLFQQSVYFVKHTRSDPKVRRKASAFRQIA